MGSTNFVSTTTSLMKSPRMFSHWVSLILFPWSSWITIVISSTPVLQSWLCRTSMGWRKGTGHRANTWKHQCKELEGWSSHDFWDSSEWYSIVLVVTQMPWLLDWRVLEAASTNCWGWQSIWGPIVNPGWLHHVRFWPPPTGSPLGETGSRRWWVEGRGSQVLKDAWGGVVSENRCGTVVVGMSLSCPFMFSCSFININI